MLIIGDLSGIQDYLFDVASEGGQQARRLRARSFYIQLVAECLALRMLHAAECSKEHLLFCSAGKFLIEAPALSTAQQQKVQAEARQLNEWLFQNTNAQLRLSLVINESAGTPQNRYEAAIQHLQVEKSRPWANVVASAGEWNTSTLRLASIGEPCVLCKRRKGVVAEEADVAADQARLICRQCEDDRRLGKDLPRNEKMWVVLSDFAETEAAIEMPGWFVKLEQQKPFTHRGPLLHLTAQSQSAKDDEPNIYSRALTRHIPRNEADNTAKDFRTIAGLAKGDKLLGVLKADADSLGNFINGLLAKASDLAPLSQFSRELDDFFGVTLDRTIRKEYSDSIYTIFAGGDDLLLVGPWNVMFDFAGVVNEMFWQKFGKHGLTLSAGITLIKPKRPINHAVERAEELLHLAKTQPAPKAAASKNQLAAFGQIWKWQDHAAILAAAKQLTSWMDDKENKVAERGWLQTLLRLAEQRRQGVLATQQLAEQAALDDLAKARLVEQRQQGVMATSRLAYQVARNFPNSKDRNPDRRALRQWADRLVTDFETADYLETIYLPTIVRYALTATRSVNTEG